MDKIIKKGSLVKVKRISYWESPQFEWDAPHDEPKEWAIVLYPLHGHDFRTSPGYETWKIRFTDGTTGVYSTKDMKLVENS